MLNTNLGLVDFHSHILAGVDDGAVSLETSLKMLELAKSQGVDTMVSTSHYYNFKEDIKSFIQRRDDAVYALGKYITEHDLDLPEIVVAAEVRVFPDMHKAEDLNLLCIEGTKNILLEMPYTAWTDWMYNEIYALITMGYRPIMAHIERFFGPVKEKTIFSKLLSMDVLVQCNAESFAHWRERRFINKLIAKNRLTVIGSDCHNLGTRLPNIDIACDYIRKKYGEDYVNIINENARQLIK